ncbi:MAG: hypothetical protein GY797_10935, partial [Deltaproteobacteria bacterium]|nr:hypothetical protein [Deltaproteobacteria bacterium]
MSGTVNLQEQEVTMGNARYLFFLLIALYIGLLVFFGLPAVHAWHDPVIVRDTGTMWASLSWQLPWNDSFSGPIAVMYHIEGPLQFLLLNAYYYTIGDILPLNPMTTQIPHAIITFFCVYFFYLIGKKVHSEKFGYLCAVMFVLIPWLPITA